MTYLELPSDHAFTAFLSALTPGKVLRDRERTFSKVERKRQRFLREQAKHRFTETHERIARESLARQEKTK